MTLIAAYGLDNYDDITEFVTNEVEWVLIDIGTGGDRQLLTTGGRFNGGRLRSVSHTSFAGEDGAGLIFATAQPKTIFFGVSILREPGSNSLDSIFLRIKEGGNEHLRLQYVVSTTLTNVIVRGSTIGTFSWSSDVWHRMEIKLTVDDAVGEVTIRLDNNEVFTATGIDTQQGTNAWTDRIDLVTENRLGAHENFDDIVVNDDQGTTNNTWLGDLKIETLRPTAAGDATDFTPSAGANWENVDDLTGPDEDTTFNESAVAGHQDLYTTADLSGTPNTIHAVVIRATARKDDAGSRSIQLLSKTGVTTDVGASQVLLTSYTNFHEIHEIDPDTTVAWTPTGVNGIQIGAENV